MALITKKIGKNEYAYLVIREGRKVVHKYLGPVSNPAVIKIMEEQKDVSFVPERFRPLFWDTSLINIKIRKNARYIIERVLEFGDMDAVQWIQRVYPARDIINVMKINRIISEKSRNFWMIWFGVSDV